MSFVYCLTRDAEGVRDPLPRPPVMDRLCDRGTLESLSQAAECDDCGERLCRVGRCRDVVQIGDLSILVDRDGFVNLG